ncbi:hypothetical protein B0H15DRAFT_832052 [Mycena belliarum]|uniref:Uncharacterized protein n=1 Tax=Mycena belliarum TaxID=1033014 RepID=A0AAD6UC36_9AGAR|nr:hypothetical protein B0H15DRAFT_832052 [Mycena belliae]
MISIHDLMSEELKAEHNGPKEPLWHQILYIGDTPDAWLAPEPIEGKDVEPQRGWEEPIFHLPAFLRDPVYMGDMYPLSAQHRSHPAPFRSHSYPVVPQAWARVSYAHTFQTPNQSQYPDLWLVRKPCTPKPRELAPPWPHYNQPHLYALPPSRPASPPAQSLDECAASPRVFHPPLPADLSARLKAVQVLCDQRAQAASAELGRKAESGLAIPPDTCPPYQARSSSPSPSPSPPPSPFRLLPPLSTRFPLYFATAETTREPMHLGDDSDEELYFDGAETGDWAAFPRGEDDAVHSFFAEDIEFEELQERGDEFYGCDAFSDPESDDEGEEVFWDTPEPVEGLWA